MKRPGIRNGAGPGDLVIVDHAFCKVRRSRVARSIVNLQSQVDARCGDVRDVKLGGNALLRAAAHLICKSERIPVEKNRLLRAVGQSDCNVQMKDCCWVLLRKGGPILNKVRARAGRHREGAALSVGQEHVIRPVAVSTHNVMRGMGIRNPSIKSDFV